VYQSLVIGGNKIDVVYNYIYNWYHKSIARGKKGEKRRIFSRFIGIVAGQGV